MARICPRVTIFGYPLNPGPFTIKEHVVVTIMAGVGAETAYAVRPHPSSRLTLSPLLLLLHRTPQDRHCGCPTSALRKDLQLWLPIHGRHVYSTHRFLNRRYRQAISRLSPIYEYVQGTNSSLNP